MLGLTFFPNLLYVTNRSIYYILKGSIEAQRKDTKAAEEYFQKALSLKLPSDNEKAMVLLQMCNIQMMKNNWPGAQNYFMQVKKLHISEKLIKEQIDQVEKAINSRGMHYKQAPPEEREATLKAHRANRKVLRAGGWL